MLSLLISTLRQHLNAHLLPAAPGIRQLVLPWPDGAAVSLLNWLNAWPLYPQCYWQHRDGHEEVASCGAVRHFAGLDAAQRFLAAQPASSDLRIWGLNAFGAGEEVAESALFLPRLSWRRQGEGYQVILTLCSATSLAADAADFLAWLETHGPAAPAPLPPLTAKVTGVAHLPDLPAWRRLVQQALAQFGQGGLDKVVLARRSALSVDLPPSPLSLMAASRQVNHRCFHYLLAWSPHDAFLGSSPERLYHRYGHRLDTEALAGTVACDPDPQQASRQAAWLMADEKNQRENLLVVDDICQRLRQAALALDVSGPEVIPLRTVQHLRRVIQGDLQYADDSRCLALLQPTAAVAGLPRRPACRGGRRRRLSGIMNLSRASGTPGQRAISPPARASFAWRCAAPGCRISISGFMPAPVLCRDPMPIKNGRKWKIKPPVCNHSSPARRAGSKRPRSVFISISALTMDLQ